MRELNEQKLHQGLWYCLTGAAFAEEVMSDQVRLAGRRTHIDLYDADLHDLTVEWIVGQFGFNGPMQRFAPSQRTSGGITTANRGCIVCPGCNEESDDCCRQVAVDVDTRECGEDSDGVSRRRCGFAYVDGTLSQDRETTDGQIELGQVNETKCACPHVDIPIAGSGRYFAVPGFRFPMITRSSACNPEYIGEQVADWLEELDEAYHLVLAGWEVPASPQSEPPIRAPAVAERVELLMAAILELLVAGESDLRLLRLSDGGSGVGRLGLPC